MEKKKNYWAKEGTEEKNNFTTKKIGYQEPKNGEKKEVPSKKYNGEKKVIALSGGATGGHIFPLVALYNYLQEEGNYDFFWFGEEDGIEFDIAKQKNIPFVHIPAGKLRRYFDWRNFYEPLKNFTGIVFAIYALLKNKIDIVFSKGGYVSLPVCIAAVILRKKVFIHESDTVGGISNKIVSKLATKIFLTFPNKEIKNSKQYIVSGQILNPELLDGLKNIELDEHQKLQILVTGGSQGSTRIFDAVSKIAPDFPDIDFSVLLGTKNTGLKEELSSHKNITTIDFMEQKDLGKLLKKTDIAITRGGATTLFELMHFGIHSIIIPLPESAGNHQQKNAEYFREKYESDIIEERKNLEIELFRKIKKYRLLRKGGVHIENFLHPLQIIKEEIEAV